MTLLTGKVYAVNVSNIEINPPSPAYGEKFDCILTVDYDESMLACDMLRLDDPDTIHPWDICPKRDDLGHRYTSGNQRYYHCVADQSTGVPGPGTYRIVAWRFYSDGMYGDVIAQKEITIREKPLPTSTPKPSNTPYPSKSPTPRPTRVPTVMWMPTPTRVPSLTLFPPTLALTPTIEPTLTGFPPTPTPVLSSAEPTSSEIFPTVDFYPIHEDIPLQPTPTPKEDRIGPIISSIPEKIGVGFSITKNFIVEVIINFLRETSF